tara:strand:+ start:251 stop:577 length:327 start_codon:yes stop_codon:yes gene_type:complete
MCVTAYVASAILGTALIGNEIQSKERRRQEDRFDKKQSETQTQIKAQQDKYDADIAELTKEEENPLMVANQYQKGKKGMDMLKIKKTPSMGKTSVGGMNSQTGVNIAS